MCLAPLRYTDLSLYDLLHASFGGGYHQVGFHFYGHMRIKKFKTIFIFKFIQFFTRLIKK